MKNLLFLSRVVGCGRLMARWKAENETSSVMLSKKDKYGSGFSLQQSHPIPTDSNSEREEYHIFCSLFKVERSLYLMYAM